MKKNFLPVLGAIQYYQVQTMSKQKTTAMMFPIKAHLRERSTGARVPASVHPMGKRDLAERSCWAYQNDDEDQAWEWPEILEDSQSGSTECYALYARGHLQGLAFFDTQGQATASGHALVVDYLASRPGNRRGEEGFKDVGTALLAIAVHRSRELGWAGRLWLESLPGAEPVYTRLRFTRLEGRSKEGYAMYELSEENAKRLFDFAMEQGIVSLP